MVILKIIISFLVLVFWIWVEMQEGKSIRKKATTDSEHRYLDILQIYMMTTIFIFWTIIWT